MARKKIKLSSKIKKELERKEDKNLMILIKDRIGTPESEYVSHEEAWKNFK